MKQITLTVQRWGNSLAVRIPAALARRAHFEQGTSVDLVLQEIGVMIKPTGHKQLSLKERLALFDPQKHSGEIMAINAIGKEKF